MSVFQLLSKVNFRADLRIVAGAFASLAAVVLVSEFGATSAGTKSYDANLMASWLQAIGSVAAIVGALWIAERQTKIAMRVAERERRAQIKARRLIVTALMENAVRQVSAVKQSFSEGPEEFPFGLTYNESDFEAAIRHIQAINLLELGEVDLARGIIGMVDAMVSIRRLVHTEKVSKDRWRWVNGVTLCDRVEGAYARAMLAIGREPIVCPFERDENGEEIATEDF